jgi:hypothetical protein
VQGKPTKSSGSDFDRRLAAAQAKQRAGEAELRNRHAAMAERQRQQGRQLAMKHAELKQQQRATKGSGSSDNVVVPGSRKAKRGADPLKETFKQWAKEDRQLATLKKREEAARAQLGRAETARRGRGSRIQSNAELRAREKLGNASMAVFDLEQIVKKRRDQPQPPQSVTGTDRSGTFTKDVPVTGEKNTRTKSALTETDPDELMNSIDSMTEAESMAWLRKLAPSVPREELRRMARESGTTLDELGL